MVEISGFIDVVLKYAVAPIGAFVWWLFKKYDYRIDSLEIRMHEMEKETAILSTKLDAIKEDMVEIKTTLNTLITMLQNRGKL